MQVPAGARVHRASPAPLGVLGGCQDADGGCPSIGIATTAHFPVTAWLSPGVCSQCCPGSRPRSSPSPCLVAPGAGSVIRGWRQPDAPVTGAARPAVPALCKHPWDGAGGGRSQDRQPRNLLARQIGHRTRADASAPGARPLPCADGYQGWPRSGGSTTPPKHRVEPKLCLSPLPIADPDQHHDNHNRVQLWGSQTCPRVSGLRSHSQSCSILGPCSMMGTAEVPGAPGDQPRSPPCGAGLWLSRVPPTVTPISVLVIAKSCCSWTRSTAWLEERDSALGASVQLFWSRASGSVAAIPVVPVAG